MNCKNCIHNEVCKDWYKVIKEEFGVKRPWYDNSCTDRFQAKTEWISVHDRLPTPFVSVLVYMPEEVPHTTVHEGFVNKRGEWYAGGFDRLPDEVVAWTPLPEPPEMKGGAE